MSESSDSSLSGEKRVCSPHQMTVRSCEVWNELPEEIKQDPILAMFKEGYRLHYKKKEDTDQTSSKGTCNEGQSECKQEALDNFKKTIEWINYQDKFTSQANENNGEKPSTSFVSELASTDVPRQKTDTSLPLFYKKPLHRGEEDLDEEVVKSPFSHRCTKLTVFVVAWSFFTIILMTKREHNFSSMHQISISENEIRNYWIIEHPNMHQINLEVEGALLPHYYGNLSQRRMTIWIELVQTRQTTRTNQSKLKQADVFHFQRITTNWVVPLVSEDLIDFVPLVRRRKLFDVNEFDDALIPQSILRIRFKTNLAATFPVAISYDVSPINPAVGIIYAAIVLVILYVLIIFEIVHRTVAAISAAIMSIAILAVLNERPTKMEIISWVDMETLLLLSSMMAIVTILSKSGVFDYLAVLVYKFTGGQVWPLVNTLCLFTALVSSFLDNVTTALLMTPVSIRLCEVMELNPVPILMAMIMFSNIGGALTPVGDPPNVIISMNEDIVNAGVNFGTFTLHMGIPLTIVMICVNIQLRYMFRNKDLLRFAEPQDIQELRHEITVWKHAAASLSLYSKDEDVVRVSLLKKVRSLLQELKTKLHTGSVPLEKYTANLEELQQKYPIRDKWLLLKSCVALFFVIVMFFFHSIPELNLSMGWAALLGAVLLLLLADEESVDGVLARVEWSTLIFFGALFILMEALARLGLIDCVGNQTEEIIMSVDEEYRLGAAILLVLWVSGLASSFVDNIPLTTMMVKIITRLSQKEGLELPLQPLVWALALGACLGGNGTLIGASSNVVCAGVAEQHGYRFSFMEFLKMGFPVTMMSMFVATIYLLIAHVWLEWNG